jgi:hypothetical protein
MIRDTVKTSYVLRFFFFLLMKPEIKIEKKIKTKL